MGLQCVNGVSNYVTVPAASSINNLATGFYVAWVKAAVLPPAATRNIWGKSTGTDRFILNFTATSVESTYAGTVTPCRAIATYANLPAFLQDVPTCFAAQWSFGVLATKLYAGNDGNPLIEAPAYSSQSVGSGAGHDDSAANLIIGSDGTASTANAFPGNLYSLQLFNRLPYGIEEMQELKREWMPTRSGCVGAWRFGQRSTEVVIDESGQGNHGAITGATKTSDYPLPHERKETRVLHRAMTVVQQQQAVIAAQRSGIWTGMVYG